MCTGYIYCKHARSELNATPSPIAIGNMVGHSAKTASVEPHRYKFLQLQSHNFSHKSRIYSSLPQWPLRCRNNVFAERSFFVEEGPLWILSALEYLHVCVLALVLLHMCALCRDVIGLINVLEYTCTRVLLQ